MRVGFNVKQKAEISNNPETEKCAQKETRKNTKTEQNMKTKKNTQCFYGDENESERRFDTFQLREKHCYGAVRLEKRCQKAVPVSSGAFRRVPARSGAFRRVPARTDAFRRVPAEKSTGKENIKMAEKKKIGEKTVF